ncbi:Sigma-70, region 4 [uncultured archaeon]|nr:Sigma-70, region 4 [uncultured archaeon]
MSTLLEISDDVREVSHEVLLAISSSYLTPLESDFISLALKRRRTKEIAELLELPPCEVVRRRKVISRKIRAVYTYHYKMNYVEFLRFAVKVLTPDKFKCLLLHYVELKALKDIATEFGIQPSTAQRWLQSSKITLDEAMGPKSKLRPYLKAFEDIPYLNIKSIRRSKEDARRLNRLQVGENTLGEWLSKRFTSEPS